MQTYTGDEALLSEELQSCCDHGWNSNYYLTEPNLLLPTITFQYDKDGSCIWTSGNPKTNQAHCCFASKGTYVVHDLLESLAEGSPPDPWRTFQVREGNKANTGHHPILLHH